MAAATQVDREFERRLKWLMFFRALFAVFLFGSTIFFTRIRYFSYDSKSLLFLYAIAAALLIISICYVMVLPLIRHRVFFTYLQHVVDTVAVTLIVYITGCFASAFSFLYLIVIISACFFLFRRGGMIIAALCSIQYGVMIDLEYYGLLSPLDVQDIFVVTAYSAPHVLYKMITTIIACFGVAFLTSLLVEQERRARNELGHMKSYVKRVERLATVGEMAAGLAHEIKNPLAALTGAIEMLDDTGPSSPDNTRLMKIIRREAKRLNSLVTNFLLFAKPQKGKVKKITLDKILDETVSLFETGLPADGKILCRKNIARDVEVEMDPEYLRQILWNLLLNAADAIWATAGQAGTITVNLYTSPSGSVRLEIIDDGCGISADDKDLIFDPFFTTKSHGTGLGLSVVQRLIESYDGRLDLDSQPGSGTRFVLILKPAAS
ncbi:MAG: two-component system sensor histidine kinase NtrB [Desulfosudaceae bacterium]